METIKEQTEAEALSDEERERWDPMAKDLYERYGQSVGWTAVGDRKMPTWEEVRENRRVHGAWCIVARHTVLPGRLEMITRQKTARMLTTERIRLLVHEARRALNTLVGGVSSNTLIDVLTGDIEKNLSEIDQRAKALTQYYVDHPPGERPVFVATPSRDLTIYENGETLGFVGEFDIEGEGQITLLSLPKEGNEIVRETRRAKVRLVWSPPKEG